MTKSLFNLIMSTWWASNAGFTTGVKVEQESEVTDEWKGILHALKPPGYRNAARIQAERPYPPPPFIFLALIS